MTGPTPRNPNVGKNYKLVLVCQPEKDLPYYLIRGRETFYDEDDYHIRFKEIYEAYQWAEQHLGILPSHHLPDGAKERAEEGFDEWKKTDQQKRLF
jgi:hypothetical protein